MIEKSIAKKVIAVVVIGIGAIVLGLNSVADVPVGSTGVVLNMGKVSGKTMSEGLNFKTPFVVSVVSMSNMVQKLDAEAYATSKDLQAITSDVTVNYHLAAERSASMYQNVGKNYADTLLQPAVQEVIKSVMAQYSAEQLISNRSAVSVAISEGLTEKVSNYGIVVDEFNIVNFSFSPEFDAAIEAKQIAEQNKIKAQTEKDKKVIDAEAQAAEKKIAAEADAEAIRLKAEAEAEAIKLKAEAQAEANALLNNSLSKNVLYYQQLQKWDGRYPNMIAGESYIVIGKHEYAKDRSFQLLNGSSSYTVKEFTRREMGVLEDNEDDEDLLLEVLREECMDDRISINVVDMTALGFVELTRSKSRKPLREQMFACGLLDFFTGTSRRW